MMCLCITVFGHVLILDCIVLYCIEFVCIPDEGHGTEKLSIIK